MLEKINVFLPDRYYLCTGDTFQLFYRGVVEAPTPYIFDILPICSVGKVFPRYFEYTPSEAGEYALTINVYGPGKKLLGSAQTTLVVNEPKESEKKVNIMCIGASDTQGGVWVREVYRRLCENGGEPAGHGFKNYEFIGTQRNGEVGFEAYGGWTWTNYTSKYGADNPSMWAWCKHNKTPEDQHSLWQDENGAIWQIETLDTSRLKFNRYLKHNSPRVQRGVLKHYKNAVNKEDIVFDSSDDEIANPFYDEEKDIVSVKNYCDVHAFPYPDIVYIRLAMNGLSANAKPYEEYVHDVVAQGKVLVDLIHRELPKTRVCVVTGQIPSVNGGCGANYGAAMPYCDTFGLAHYLFLLAKAYRDWVNEEGYKDFMEYVNIAGQFDSENNNHQTQKCVNIRNKTVETVDTNALHPAPSGNMQIADAIYRSIVGIVCREER